LHTCREKAAYQPPDRHDIILLMRLDGVHSHGQDTNRILQMLQVHINQLRSWVVLADFFAVCVHVKSNQTPPRIMISECVPRLTGTYYTKTTQFHRLHLFSSVHGKPTKITKLVCRFTKADEIILIFIGLIMADETKVLFSSA
jgi:hypothetical protein